MPLPEPMALLAGEQHARLRVSPVASGRERVSRRIVLSGHVQGVGFRPFVFRQATELGLRGTVRNNTGTVEIIVQGKSEALDSFAERLASAAPPLAKPVIDSIDSIDSPVFENFRILASNADEHARIFVPPDFFLCADCAAEQADPHNRRYRYPFINCTQCGPRFTIIECLPYDRTNTSMAGFQLCPECHAEYRDPLNRRYHAEPVACPSCGPQLRFSPAPATTGTDVVAAAVAVLRNGGILAVKGIGGYHLLCDARRADAVALLRSRKQRPDKPVAVMFGCDTGDLEPVRQCVELTERAKALLCSPGRPIVLARQRQPQRLAGNIAPGLDEIGVFLAYSPLHRLLLDEFAGPVVATSGNVSGEPVLTNDNEAARRLHRVADAFLHHDRPIVRPADDSVFRDIAGALRPIRIGRGFAPLEIDTERRQSEPILCLGGHMKVTITLSWAGRAVISPHIADLDSPRSLAVFRQTVDDLQRLYRVSATRLVCDAHPGYASSRFARRQRELPVSTVWHHHAHASALAAERQLQGDWLVFAWDGVGLGEDGTLWGGEALLGNCGTWKRIASLRPFRPPGGDAAAREPWRSAAALLWEAGRPFPLAPDGIETAHKAWMRGINCPQTSAAGRLFDAAAMLICGTACVSYEAQGPMQLEALCRRAGTAMPLPLAEDEAGVLRSDWAPLLSLLPDQRLAAPIRAELFHSSMARIVLDQAVALRQRHSFAGVGLAGGVFQNRRLTEQAARLLRFAGFEVRLHRQLPSNDAALSFGQAAEYAARDRHTAR